MVWDNFRGTGHELSIVPIIGDLSPAHWIEHTNLPGGEALDHAIRLKFTDQWKDEESGVYKQDLHSVR